MTLEKARESTAYTSTGRVVKIGVGEEEGWLSLPVQSRWTPVQNMDQMLEAKQESRPESCHCRNKTPESVKLCRNRVAANPNPNANCNELVL